MPLIYIYIRVPGINCFVVGCMPTSTSHLFTTGKLHLIRTFETSQRTVSTHSQGQISQAFGSNSIFFPGRNLNPPRGESLPIGSIELVYLHTFTIKIYKNQPFTWLNIPVHPHGTPSFRQISTFAPEASASQVNSIRWETAALIHAVDKPRTPEI